MSIFEKIRSMSISVSTVFNSEYIPHLMAQGRSPHTISSRKSRLRAFLSMYGHLRINQVNRRVVNEYMIKLRKESSEGKYTDSTVNTTIASLKAFFKWCVIVGGYLTDNPALHLEREDVNYYEHKKAIEEGDLGKMILYVKSQSKSVLGMRNYAIIALLADSGARVGELCNIQVDRLKFDKTYNGAYEVRTSGKSGKNTVLTFNEETAILLLEWLDVRPEADNDRLFIAMCPWHSEPYRRCMGCRSSGKPLKPLTVHRLLKSIGKKSGVKGICNPHSFRHRVGIVYEERFGGRAAQQKLGHAKFATTEMFYVPPRRHHSQKATAQMSLSDLYNIED